MKLRIFRRKSKEPETPETESPKKEVPVAEKKKIPELDINLAEGFWSSPGLRSWIASEDRAFLLPESGKAFPDVLTICRLALAAVMIIVTVFVKGLPDVAVLIIRAVAAAVAGYDMVISFIGELRRKSLIFEGLPMLMAVILAFINGMSLEGAVAALLFRLSLCVRSYLFCRSEDMLMASASLPAVKSELRLGDSFMAEAGMTIPADCIIAQGSLTADLSFVFGERAEMGLKQGDFLPAGSVCLGGSALVEICGLPENTVSHELSKRMLAGYRSVTPTEKKAERYSLLLTPVLLLLSLVLIIVLPLASDMAVGEALRRVVSLLAIASPCGVLISIPIAYLASMSLLRCEGVAFKTASALDAAGKAGTLVFDKAGTITADRYTVSGISTDRMDPPTFLKVAAHAASISDCPIARAIVAACGEPLNPSLLGESSETPGWGVSVTVDNISILLGTPYFMEKSGVEVPFVAEDQTRVYMAVNGIPAGHISLLDSIDPQARNTVKALADAGIDRIAMVSEDSRDRDGLASSESGIGEYYAECTNEDKIRNITELRGKTGPNKTVVFVSARDRGYEVAGAADLHVVLDCATVPVQEADALILSDSVSHVVDAISGPKRARRNLFVGLFSALGFKLIITVLASLGLLPLWFCVFIDACGELGLILAMSYFNTRKAA